MALCKTFMRTELKIVQMYVTGLLIPLTGVVCLVRLCSTSVATLIWSSLERLPWDSTSMSAFQQATLVTSWLHIMQRYVYYLSANFKPVTSSSFITGPHTHSVGDQYWFAVWRRLSSVVVCNTPRRACRRLHPRRTGDDVMPPSV